MDDIRYNRQKDLSIKTDDSLLIVGCGGIGYNVAKISALSGIKNFYLFDDDVLESHNLNRIDVPENAIGMNKAEMTSKVILNIRNDISVIFYPFRLNKSNFPFNNSITWMVDCTDNFKSQQNNYKLSKSSGIKYIKAGYDGESFSIHNSPASWGDLEVDNNGYTITPSWAPPAILVACLTVAKIMKYHSSQLSSNIKFLMENL